MEYLFYFNWWWPGVAFFMGTETIMMTDAIVKDFERELQESKTDGTSSLKMYYKKLFEI